MRRQLLGLLVATMVVACGGVPPSPSPALPTLTAPTASPTPLPTETATPTSTVEPSSSPLASTGGTCTASQLVLGTATSYGLFMSLGLASSVVNQPIRNAGDGCLLGLPATIEVAAATGEFVAVSVGTGTSASLALKPGQSGSIKLQATMYVGYQPPGRTPEPCANMIRGVTRARIPHASGTLEVDLGTVWANVCASPASVSISIHPE